MPCQKYVCKHFLLNKYFITLGAGSGCLYHIVKSEQGIQVPHSGGSTNLNKQIRGKTQGMRCLYTNAQSMGNKQEELELLVQQSRYDLMGITETWWDESHDWNVSILGYNLYKRNRPNKRGGGEEALYVRDL